MNGQKNHSEIFKIDGVGVNLSRFHPCSLEEKNALRTELGYSEKDFIITVVAELNKNKNHRAVLQALARMENRNLYYVVCGRGPLKEELEAFAREKGLADRVRFMGYRDDVPFFYAMADVFVFPSFREGLPVSVMEAMASGLPIVCSRIRGNTDLVQEGVNGFLMDPQDPRGIADAVLRLENPRKRQEIADINRENAGHFDLSEIVEKYREIYLGIG